MLKICEINFSEKKWTRRHIEMGVVNLTLIFRQTKHLYDASIQLPSNEKRPAFGWTAFASLISA